MLLPRAPVVPDESHQASGDGDHIVLLRHPRTIACHIENAPDACYPRASLRREFLESSFGFSSHPSCDKISCSDSDSQDCPLLVACIIVDKP